VRLLLDHCVPVRFGPLLVGHEVRTARDAGLDALQNGALLRQAAVVCDVVLTVDRGLVLQRDLRQLPVAVLVVASNSNRLDDLRRQVDPVLRALPAVTARSAWLVGLDGVAQALFVPSTP
jgi:CheY-like chemotaxis protein